MIAHQKNHQGNLDVQPPKIKSEIINQNSTKRNRDNHRGRHNIK